MRYPLSGRWHPLRPNVRARLQLESVAMDEDTQDKKGSRYRLTRVVYYQKHNVCSDKKCTILGQPIVFRTESAAHRDKRREWNASK